MRPNIKSRLRHPKIEFSNERMSFLCPDTHNHFVRAHRKGELVTTRMKLRGKSVRVIFKSVEIVAGKFRSIQQTEKKYNGIPAAYVPKTDLYYRANVQPDGSISLTDVYDRTLYMSDGIIPSFGPTKEVRELLEGAK
ncbi:MAG: hypothetical protein ABIH20_04685 [Candidatus Diapherotrites archaeon]